MSGISYTLLNKDGVKKGLFATWVKVYCNKQHAQQAARAVSRWPDLFS